MSNGKILATCSAVPVLVVGFGAVWCLSGISPKGTRTIPENVDRPTNAQDHNARPLLPWVPVAQEHAESATDKQPANSYLAMGGSLEELSTEELEPYLRARNHSAESLVVAAKLTGDSRWLNEALVRFPENPRVQLALALSQNTPNERGSAIEAFRRLDPENSLGDYLLAREFFRNGDRQAGIETFLRAGQRTYFTDYGREFAREFEEALLISGFTPLQACAFTHAHPKNEISGLVLALTGAISDLQMEWYESGKQHEIATIAWSGLDMLKHFRGAGQRSMVDEAVESVVAKQLLKLLPPDMSTPEKKTVAEISAEADALKEEIFELAEFSSLALEHLDEQNALRYYRSIETFGGVQALRNLARELGGLKPRTP